MTKIEKVIFTGNTHTKINHDPSAQHGEFGVVDIKLSAPGGKDYAFIAAEHGASSRPTFSPCCA
jgi:osmotically inducible protein OsmC